MERNTRWDIGIAMTWKDILKENRLVSQNITHTKVDENKPEQSDDRCKEALKKIIMQLHTLYSYGDNSQRLFVQTVHSGLTVNRIAHNAEAFSVLIEQIDSCPEEICCDILEQFKRLEQEGKNWLNNLQNAIIEAEWQAGIENFKFQYDHLHDEYEGKNKVKVGTFFEEIYTYLDKKSREGVANPATPHGLVLAVRLNYNEKGVVFHLRYNTDLFLREELVDIGNAPIIAVQNVAYGAIEDIVMMIGAGAGMI